MPTATLTAPDLLIWQARVALGLGQDIWTTVGIPTVVQEE